MGTLSAEPEMVSVQCAFCPETFEMPDGAVTMQACDKCQTQHYTAFWATMGVEAPYIEQAADDPDAGYPAVWCPSG
jgi:hypothetical protein